MNELSIMLTLLLQRIVARHVELIGTSHPLPLAHVVGRHPAQIANAIHRTHDVRLEHIRSHDERSLVRSGRPTRVDTEHSTLGAVRTGEGLDQRVLATGIGEAGREQIRHMPEVLNHPVRADSLEQLRTSASTLISVAQVIAERGVVLSDTLRSLQADIQRKHRAVAAVANETGAIGIRSTVANEGSSRDIEHLLSQLRRRLIQILTNRSGLNPRELIHARGNRLILSKGRVGHSLDRELGERILIANLPRTLSADRELLQVHAQERLDAVVIGQIILT